MKEIRLKRINLFLLESIIMQDDRIIDDFFAYQFNLFIERYYKDNKELFAILYEPKLLEKCLENNYEILSTNQMTTLINRYHGFFGYSKLLDDIGPEIDKQLIKLATLFTEYCNSLSELYNQELSAYYPKGLIKILQ